MNLAIIGLGEVARKHRKAWRRINHVNLAAVCDADRQRAGQTAREWGVPAYADDLGEILRDGSISMVDICAPPLAHGPLVLQALAAGCHVVVEKPLTMTTGEARTIIACHKGSQAKLTVIHNWLYVPVMRKALACIKQNGLGDIISLEVRVLHPPQDPMLCRKDHWCHSLPGGRLGEMLAHPIYLAQAMLGPLKVRSVQALKRGSYPWVNHDELRVGLEANQGSASFYVSFNASRADILIDIYGTGGRLVIDLLSDTLVKLNYRSLSIPSKGMDSLYQSYQLARSITRGAVSKLSGRWIGGLEFCLRAFADSVLKGRDPLVSVSQAYDTVGLLEPICGEIDSGNRRM